jgi:DnaK suppressor protein
MNANVEHDKSKAYPCNPEDFAGLTAQEAYKDGYLPTDKEKGYMNDTQKAYFSDMLNCWRLKLQEEANAAVVELQEHSSIEPDVTDQASIEMEQTFDLRTRDRASKLIKKIDEALQRIKEDEFGYCQVTGDPIGVARLLARPIATLCIEEKRRQEQQEGGYAG